MKIEIGKLYRINGNIPIRTDDGYLMAAYLFHPRDSFYDKQTIWDAKPLIMNDEVVLVVNKPMFPNHEGVHVLYEDKIFFLRTDNLTYL